MLTTLFSSQCQMVGVEDRLIREGPVGLPDGSQALEVSQATVATSCHGLEINY